MTKPSMGFNSGALEKVLNTLRINSKTTQTNMILKTYITISENTPTPTAFISYAIVTGKYCH